MLADASDALNSLIGVMCLSELSQLQTLETLGVIDGEQFIALLRTKADLYESADVPAPVVAKVMAEHLRSYANAIEQGHELRPQALGKNSLKVLLGRQRLPGAMNVL